MKYKYTIEDSFKFGWKGLQGYAYNSKDDFHRASAAYFEVTERHGRVKNLVNDRIYYVIDGEGHFIIDKQVINVKPTDVIIVPRNTEYDYTGKMKLLLVHTPAFDAENDVDFEGMQED